MYVIWMSIQLDFGYAKINVRELITDIRNLTTTQLDQEAKVLENSSTKYEK